MSINIRNEFMNMFTEEELREIRSYTKKCVIVNSKCMSSYRVEQSIENMNIKK